MNEMLTKEQKKRIKKVSRMAEQDARKERRASLAWGIYYAWQILKIERWKTCFWDTWDARQRPER